MVVKMKKIILGFTLVLLSACGVAQTAFQSAPAGAVTGTALGAGIGAGIGAIIKNGDIGKSSLLGAAIGIAAGGIIGAINKYNSEEEQRKRFLAKVRHNQQEIFDNEREIDILRREVEKEIPHGLPNENTKKHLYEGN